VVLVLFKVKSDLKHIFEQLINWDVDIVIGLILLSTTTAPTTTAPTTTAPTTTAPTTTAPPTTTAR